MRRSTYSDSLDFFGDSTPHELVRQFGSPLYVYNEQMLRTRCRDLRQLVQHPRFFVSYSTKANANPHLLRLIREEGLMADAMSPGELAVLREAGFTPAETHYVCNNVSTEELVMGARQTACVGVDSLSQLASFGAAAPGSEVMVRVNPGIGAGHHKKVITAGAETKFGVSPDDFLAMENILREYGLVLMGLNQHVGSQFLDDGAYLAAAAWLLETARRYPSVRLLDFGGGLGIPYRKYDGEKPLDLSALGARLTSLLAGWTEETEYQGDFIIESGRYVTAECGLLLGTATAVKNNGPVRYVGSDLGFSVLVRPVLYNAFHDMEVHPHDGQERDPIVQTVVGNICETGDVLAKDRLLPEIVPGDIVGVLDAGAYSSSMASNYNLRQRPAEVLVREDGTVRLIRRRDTIEDILSVYQVENLV